MGGNARSVSLRHKICVPGSSTRHSTESHRPNRYQLVDVAVHAKVILLIILILVTTTHPTHECNTTTPYHSFLFFLDTTVSA